MTLEAVPWSLEFMTFPHALVSSCGMAAEGPVSAVLKCQMFISVS